MISGALFLGRDTHEPATDTAERMCCASARRIRFLVGAAMPLISLISSTNAALLYCGHVRNSSQDIITCGSCYMIVGLYLLIPLLRPIAQNETLAAVFSAAWRLSSPFCCRSSAHCLCSVCPRSSGTARSSLTVVRYAILPSSRSALPPILCCGRYLSRRELSAAGRPDRCYAASA